MLCDPRNNDGEAVPRWDERESERCRPAASWLEAKFPPRASGAKVTAATLCALALPPTSDTKQVAEAVIPERSGGNDCSSGGKEQIKEEKNSAKCAAAERALRPEALECSSLAGTALPGTAGGYGEAYTAAVIFDIIQIVYIADYQMARAVSPPVMDIPPLMRGTASGQQFTPSRWDYVQ